MGNSPRKKILFLLPTLNSGGAERVLITLMNGISDQKFDKHFIVVNDTKQLKHLIKENVTCYNLEKFKLYSSILPLYKTIKKIKPDVIVSTMAHMNFLTLGITQFLPDTKIVVREAITPSFLFEKYKPWDFLIKFLYKTLYPKADLILSPTKLVFKEFDQFLDINSKKYIPVFNPVNVEHLRSHDKKFEITKGRKKTVNFICCGRLGKQKGYDRLFDALKGVEFKYPWKLDIYGEGTERQALQTQIFKNDLAHNIHLKGLVRKVSSHIAQSDYFLLPSRYEGSPNVALESLACGTKVISMAEAGGIQEIVDNGAGDNITITQTIEGFVEEMQKVEPKPKANFAPSLLPSPYHKDAAVKQFEKIILGII